MEVSSLDAFSRSLFSGLVTAARASNDISNGFTAYSSVSAFNEGVEGFGERLLGMTEKLLKYVRGEGLGLNDPGEDPSDRFNELVEVMDDIFEPVDIFIDNSKKINEEIKPKFRQIQRRGDPNSVLLLGENVARPQDKWRDDTDNGYGPFVPKIVIKHNAQLPLDDVIVKARKPKNTDKENVTAKDLSQHIHSIGLLKGPTSTDITSYPHPYQYELVHLEITNEQLQPTEKHIYKPLEETPCAFITTVEQLEELIGILKSVNEFAVDLEHHSYRSYHGFTCLMQISTREADFIIDCLELRTSMWKLNELFTDPKIIKVLHGADKDIEWLQHDFGIYVVNMFDTGQAARVLELPFFSLAYLLKLYCDRSVDKKYQLADWRIRPLPEEMKKYAQEDTHYLLYVYDCLRNQAIQSGNENSNLLRSIWLRSRDVCLTKFENPTINRDSYKSLIPKFNATLDETQLSVFAALYEWRDKTARLEDESLSYVLPNHMLFQIASLMPTDVNSLLSCCQPVPPLVKLNAPSLCMEISSAKSDIRPLRSVGSDKPLFLHVPSKPQVPQFYADVEENSSLKANVPEAVFRKPNTYLLSPLPPSSTPSGFSILSSPFPDCSTNLDNGHQTESPPQASLSKANQHGNSNVPGSYSLFRTRSDMEDEEDTKLITARRTARAILKINHIF